MRQPVRFFRSPEVTRINASSIAFRSCLISPTVRSNDRRIPAGHPRRIAACGGQRYQLHIHGRNSRGRRQPLSPAYRQTAPQSPRGCAAGTVIRFRWSTRRSAVSNQILAARQQGSGQWRQVRRQSASSWGASDANRTRTARAASAAGARAGPYRATSRRMLSLTSAHASGSAHGGPQGGPGAAAPLPDRVFSTVPSGPGFDTGSPRRGGRSACSRHQPGPRWFGRS